MRASAVRRFQGEATLNYVHKSRGVCRSAIKRTLEPHGKLQPLKDCSVDVTLSTEVSLPASSAPGAEGHGADFHWLVPPLRVGPALPQLEGWTVCPWTPRLGSRSPRTDVLEAKAASR